VLQVIVDIHKVINVYFGDKNAFARVYGFIIHEAENPLVFVELTSRFVACDDFTKYALRIERHRSIPLRHNAMRLSRGEQTSLKGERSRHPSYAAG
jgi:hypothetical protein